jgi:hypothetical protein
MTIWSSAQAVLLTTIKERCIMKLTTVHETIILNDDNPQALVGRLVELNRPCGNFVQLFPRGMQGIITSVSESGSLWIDDIGWIRPEWAEFVD